MKFEVLGFKDTVLSTVEPNIFAVVYCWKSAVVCCVKIKRKQFKAKKKIIITIFFRNNNINMCLLDSGATKLNITFGAYWNLYSKQKSKIRLKRPTVSTYFDFFKKVVLKYLNDNKRFIPTKSIELDFFIFNFKFYNYLLYYLIDDLKGYFNLLNIYFKPNSSFTPKKVVNRVVKKKIKKKLFNRLKKSITF